MSEETVVRRPSNVSPLEDEIAELRAQHEAASKEVAPKPETTTEEEGSSEGPPKAGWENSR